MRLGEGIDAFLYFLKTIQFSSPHTLRNYRLDLGRLALFVEPERTLVSITPSLLRKYLHFLYEKGFKKRSMARHLASMRSFFRYTQEQNWIEQNPMEEIETPKIEKRIPTTLTYPQVERLFNRPDTKTWTGLRDRAILELFYSSGIRLSELVSLDREDIEFSTLWMRVLGKGRKERWVPITAMAAEWMQLYWDHPDHPRQGALFLNKFGKRISPRSVDRLFQKYVAMSGLIGPITPHSIRHTIATHWLENQMNLKVIQELLGHASPSTTTIYTKVSPQLRKQVHEQYHPRGK